MADQNMFTVWNQLNDDGRHRFWREVDRLIQDFDYDKDKFKPVRQVQFDCKVQTGTRKFTHKKHFPFNSPKRH